METTLIADLWQLTDDLQCKNIGRRLEQLLMGSDPPSSQQLQNHLSAEIDRNFSEIPGGRSLEEEDETWPLLRSPTRHPSKKKTSELTGKNTKAKSPGSDIVMHQNERRHIRPLWKSLFLTTVHPWLLSVSAMCVARMSLCLGIILVIIDKQRP